MIGSSLGWPFLTGLTVWSPNGVLTADSSVKNYLTLNKQGCQRAWKAREIWYFSWSGICQGIFKIGQWKIKILKSQGKSGKNNFEWHNFFLLILLAMAVLSYWSSRMHWRRSLEWKERARYRNEKCATSWKEIEALKILSDVHVLHVWIWPHLTMSY
jgi:hypothetical protein